MWLTPERRARIYIVLTALVPIAVAYGVIAETEASMWVAVAAALLGSGGSTLAAWNTPAGRQGRHRRADE